MSKYHIDHLSTQAPAKSKKEAKSEKSMMELSKDEETIKCLKVPPSVAAFLS